MLDKKINDYTTLHSGDSSGLDLDVKIHLDVNWELYGDPYSITYDDGSCSHCQVMVKRDV